MFFPAETEPVPRWFWLGLVGYGPCRELQEEIHRARAADEIGDTLLMLEHPPVFTIGRQGGKENILVAGDELARRGIEVHQTDRGGNVTYHGPGQLVAYPIVKLASRGLDIHEFVSGLEEVFIRVTADFGVQARRRRGYPGVWVGRRKLAALGIAVRKGVTKHGIAFNVSPRLDDFKLIIPCGISGCEVTSLTRELGDQAPDMSQVLPRALHHFEEIFGDFNPADPGGLQPGIGVAGITGDKGGETVSPAG